MKDRENYFVNLDGLRFLSFLLVFFYHSFYSSFESVRQSGIYVFIKRDVFGNGNLGVNFFFVLSGFLITWLLLKEQERFGKINVISFWKRRILRIWPLFYFCIAFGFIVTPFLKMLVGESSNETADPVLSLTFLNNIDFIKNGVPDSSVLSVLWSVAIEEQFYLFWPLLLSIIPARFYPYFFGFLVSCSIVFRAMYDDPIYHEYHTFSCMGDLAIGALGAWIIKFDAWRRRIEMLSRPLIGLIYGSVIFCLLFRDDFLLQNYFIRILQRSLTSVLFLLVILEQNYARNSFFKFGNGNWMTRLGKISYGLYCLHFVAIMVTTRVMDQLHLNESLWAVLILQTMVSLIISIFIASLSYCYFEKPFLRIKERFVRVNSAQ